MFKEIVRTAILILFFSSPSHAEPEPCESLPYTRAAFGVWAVENQISVRTDLLVRLATDPKLVRMLSNKVVSGKWYDPYSDRNLYDADEVEIDHIVPLSWAWAHGASCWSREKRREFHNDQKFLVPMAASLNSKKGAKIPGEWSPPVTRARCGYIIKFARAVRIYGFDIPQSERDRLNRVGKDWCGERFSTTFLDAGS